MDININLFRSGNVLKPRFYGISKSDCTFGTKVLKLKTLNSQLKGVILGGKSFKRSVFCASPRLFRKERGGFLWVRRPKPLALRG